MSANGRRVVVVGAGIAGAAAAWAAREGARVTLIDGGAGASSFTSGALDVAPWEAIAERARHAPLAAVDGELDAGTAAFLEALGGWVVPRDRPAWLATVGGRVRPALGRDAALLDLATCKGRNVLVPRAERAAWDADALARAWNDEAPPELGVRFEAIDGPVLRWADERHAADGEIAGRHDDPARVAWLAERLGPSIAAHGGGDACAVLLGPWLGAEASAAASLSRALGVLAGEALSGIAGSAGLRFEGARKRLLGAALQGGRVAAIDPDREGVAVTFATEQATMVADAVVLAIGGLVGGGLTFTPPERSSTFDGPTAGGPAYRLSLRVAPRLLGRGAFRMGGSIHGPVLDEVAWPTSPHPSALEAAGLLHDEGALSPRVLVAGDACLGASRTIGEAIRTGLRAGRAALSAP